MVHAGAAANAAQHVLKFATDQAGAPTIDQHEIHVFRAILLAFRTRTGKQRKIIRDRLPGGRTRQQAHHGGQILQRRQYLFYAGHHHMHLGRQDGAHAFVAFIGDDRHRSGFGDDEIAAGNTHVCGQKLWPQDFSRLARHGRNVGQARPLVNPGEQVGNLFLVLVHHRRDDVRRRFIAIDLQDVFTEIGFDHLHAGSFQCLIQRHFFRHHRF